MTQIGHLVVTRDIAIQRPSDHTWFHFQSYMLRRGEWGFNLWQVDGHSTKSISDPDWSSESSLKQWLEENIERWERVPRYGWCIDNSPNPAPRGV